MRRPDPQRSYAVLVGSSRYQSSELPDLPSVRENLTGLSSVLTDPALGGLPAERCVVLRDEPDFRVVYRVLRRYAKLAEDTLVVYFAGHGRVGHRNELYLGVAETDPDELQVSALPYELVRDVFSECRAVNRVLILDCCFTGLAVRDMGGDTASALAIAGTYILTATSATSFALAPPGSTYTAFTGALLTLLRDGVPGGPEFLTFGTLYPRLLHTMTASRLPKPQHRGTGLTDQLALTRNAAYTMEGTAAPALVVTASAVDARGPREQSQPLWPLVKALALLPCMGSLQDRNFVVRLLADRFGEVLSIDEAPQPYVHIMNIVHACDLRNEGLSVLLDVVRELDGGTLPLAQVERIFAERAPVSTWRESQSSDDTPWRLVKALASLPCMGSLQDRNFIVRLLADRLGKLILVEENPEADVHVLNIVEVCDRSPGGLSALLDVLREFDEGTVAMGHVERIVAERDAVSASSEPGRGNRVLWPLVKALALLSCMGSLQDRNFVVRLVADRLGTMLPIDESPRAHVHVMNIVDACDRRTDGLLALLHVVRELDADTTHLRDVERIIGGLMT